MPDFSSRGAQGIVEFLSARHIAQKSEFAVTGRSTHYEEKTRLFLGCRMLPVEE